MRIYRHHPEDPAADLTRKPADHPHTSVPMKEMYAEMRPREKALRGGVESLTTPELWALVIGSGTKGYNVLDLCTGLMEANDNLISAIARKSLKQLLSIKGLGPKKALQVMAVTELGRRMEREKRPERPRLSSSEEIYRLIRPEMAYLDHEEIWFIFMDRQLKAIKLYQASVGIASMSLLDVRQVVKDAVLENAASAVMCHNHPAGILKPSSQDDSLTRRVKEGLGFMGIPLVDHIIVTQEGYYSYNDNGRMTI